MTPDVMTGDRKPAPSSYLKAARRIEAEAPEDLKPANVAMLSTFTSDLLLPYLIVECAARGLLAKPYFAPFNQLEQQVLDDASSLYESHPDFVVLAARAEDFAPNLVQRFITLSPADIDAELARIVERLETLVERLHRNTSASVFVFNFAAPRLGSAGLADATLEPSPDSAIGRVNQRIGELCRKFTGTYVFDYARLVGECGLKRWHDAKLWYLGRIPFGTEAQIALARRLARYMAAACFPPRKCLVVDLDNTLWGGVIGEEGLGGIALGDEYPGNVYKDFQRRLLSLRDRGILLAVASKNNEPEVQEVFREHPDCVLKADDFAAMQVHWGDKATSLASIAGELNIGTDALVFFDDSPVERAWVRAQMPEVAVVEVPDNPLGFVDALEDSGVFDSLAISEEDRKRPELYQNDRRRQRLKTEALSVDEFLRQLEMTVTIGPVGSATLPRVAQLLAKTNQFTLTTRRHTPAELQAMIEAGAMAVWLRVADRFGDNGLVGVAIAVPGSAGEWSIDSFLMSCRVLGRRVETTLLGVLSTMIRQRGGEAVVGEYFPTPKNGMVSDFYPSHGFKPADGDGRLWKLSLLTDEIPLPQFVTVRIENGDVHGQ